MQIAVPNARPYGFRGPCASTALLLVDVQRDFLDPAGFGAVQCGDAAIFAAVRRIVPAIQRVLERCRALGLPIIYTREGHRPDLTDLPAAKRLRQIQTPGGHHNLAIGDNGPMGRLLVRGEHGHDIVDELAPRPGELVVDKPGKGSFWATNLHRQLLVRGITHLLVVGVTTECCVTTTIRECNDRGYECCLLADCTDGFDAQMVKTAMDTICAQDGLFGYVGTSDDFLAQTPPPPPPPPQLQPVVPALPDDRVLSIGEWQQLYRTGQVDILQAMNQVMDRIERYQQADPAVWISLRPRDDFLAAATALAARYQYQHRPGEQQQPLPPLFGVPFGVKDSIDVAGMPTTAACPPYAYTPSANAPAVQYLLDAGALFVGKLNLDQLATGLSGCRSPYGTPHSVYSARHISGGSSSGSAVAVGAGLVSFALATDTAGSGRVPAAFNGIVGLKPTRGTISARGLVPACPSLDTISIMAQNLDDARAVWLTVAHYDELDPYAKPPAAMPSWAVDCRGARAHGCRFAVPPAALLDAVCTPAFRDLFARAVDTLLQSGAATLVEVDYTPFQTAADLLYDGTLVYSRVAALGHAFLRHNFSALHPTTQAVFGPLLGLSPTAASAAASSEAAVIPARDAAPWMVFRDQDRQAECTRQVRALFDPLAPDSIDFLLVPTAPCHPTIEQMKADPVALNSRLGIFTHAANVVDLCAVSVNAGSLIDNGIVDGKKTELELPFGVTLLGGAGFEATILEWAGIFI